MVEHQKGHRKGSHLACGMDPTDGDVNPSTTASPDECAEGIATSFARSIEIKA
jgi:hypothetical protein